MADVAARYRPQDGRDHPALRLRAPADAGGHARPSRRDAARHAAAANAAPRAHDLLEEVLEPEEMYPFHVETIRHGRDTCRAPRPICGLCPLTDVCAYYVLAAEGQGADGARPEGRLDPDGPPRYHDELIHGWMPPE